MCDPVLGPAILSSGLQLIKTKGAIDSQNEAARTNTANALQAQNDSIDQTQDQYIEQNRSLIQGGFDAILEGRANESAAYASAIQNGVQGNSVKALMRSHKQNSARSAGRAQQEIKSLRQQTGASLKHIKSTTQGRINGVPRTKMGLGDVAQIVAPIVRSQME